MKMICSGIALDESLDGGREMVQVVFDESRIGLSHPTERKLMSTLELSSCSFELGGNRDSLLFIGHPILEQTRVYVELTADVRTFLSNHPSLKKRLASELASFRKRQAQTYLWIGLFVGILALGFLMRSSIAAGLVGLIPFETEKKIADLVYDKRLQKQTENAETTAKLNLLIAPVLDGNPELRKRITVHVSSDKDANAYATIGGHVFLNRGLIETLRTPEQLLGVLAHEIAHVQERHVARSVFQGVGVFLVIQALLGDVTGIAAVLADQGTPLLILHHSRELESEADRFAVRTLLKSNVDPRGLAEALKMIDAEARKRIAGTPIEEAEKLLSKVDLWSTHPEMEGRIRDLETTIESETKGQKQKQLVFDYPDFVASVRKQY